MNLDVTLMQYHPFLFKSVSFVFHNHTTPTLSKIEGHNFYLSGGGYYDGLVKKKKKLKTTTIKFIENIQNYNANICISKFSIYRLRIFSNICLKLAIITCILP